jgi:phosphate transport system ATP-binding protein
MNNIDDTNYKIAVRQLRFYYGKNLILKNINAKFKDKSITAITGPSGQGKSTFLSLFNMLWNDIAKAHVKGEIILYLNNRHFSLLKNELALPILRRKVGMIFQEPNPLPMSIVKNMAFPMKLANIQDKKYIKHKIKTALQQTFLWEEVKERLHTSAMELSGGQKQRLCLARALVLEPEILLCDEPTSSLDTKAARVIEELLLKLKTQCTILLVSHNENQIKRVVDQTFELKDKNLFQIK